MSIWLRGRGGRESCKAVLDDMAFLAEEQEKIANAKKARARVWIIFILPEAFIFLKRI
jgi:hypothetical protein